MSLLSHCLPERFIDVPSFRCDRKINLTIERGNPDNDGLSLREQRSRLSTSSSTTSLVRVSQLYTSLSYLSCFVLFSNLVLTQIISSSTSPSTYERRDIDEYPLYKGTVCEISSDKRFQAIPLPHFVHSDSSSSSSCSPSSLMYSTCLFFFPEDISSSLPSPSSEESSPFLTAFLGEDSDDESCSSSSEAGGGGTEEG